MAGYSDATDADAQIAMEAWAAALIFDRVRGRKMTEELAASVGKRIVFEVIRQFRPDLITK